MNGPAGDMSSRSLKIAVDLLGGDDAPAVVVDGALRALTVDPELHLLLVGPPEVAGAVLGALPENQRHRVAVRVAELAVGMADPPPRAVSAATSIRVATRAHAAGEAHGVVSAGASGGTVMAAVLELGRARGVRRPPLAAWVPTMRPGHECLLLDVGGAVESTVATLVTHAELGVSYAGRLTGQAMPRVGLLSVGRESGKGDRLRRSAERALRDARGIPMEFVGLVEGDDVCLGERADVVVTDGFTGNVLLKGIEGAYRLATTMAQSGGGTPNGPAGVARAAALLGVPGVVVVCHGAATADDLASGVAFAARIARLGHGSSQPRPRSAHIAREGKS
jgi:glycerol-3-phosphate acyltransferase PlsX